MAKDNEDIVILTDENGDESEFLFLDIIEYEGEDFVVLYPVGDSSGEVVILQLENAGETEESYLGVEDEDTLMAVFNIFKEKFKDELVFEED